MQLEKVKINTYPFFKGPTLADFMFIVVKYLLTHLDHLMSHVLDLGDSLEEKWTIMCYHITECTTYLEWRANCIFSYQGFTSPWAREKLAASCAGISRVCTPCTSAVAQAEGGLRDGVILSRSHPTFRSTPWLDANLDPQVFIGC